MPLSTKFRVVLDTNIFISSLITSGNPQKIVDLAISGNFFLIVSPYIVHEIITTSEKFRPKLTNVEIDKLLEFLGTKTIRIIPGRKTSLCRDPKDNQILDLCVFGNANFLVTGDEDLLVLKTFKNTVILNPKQFLTVIK